MKELWYLIYFHYYPYLLRNLVSPMGVQRERDEILKKEGVFTARSDVCQLKKIKNSTFSASLTFKIRFGFRWSWSMSSPDEDEAFE